MPSFSEIQSIETVPSPCNSQATEVNESSSDHTDRTSSTPSSDLNPHPSSFMVLLVGIMSRLFLFTIEATKVTAALLFLPIYGIQMGTSEMKHKPRAWATFWIAIATYAMVVFLAFRRISLLLWHVFRLMVGIYSYHSKYIMSVLDLDDSNPVSIGCHRKRGGYMDPHPETLSFLGYIHHQGCKGQNDGAYDQDERFLQLLKLILIALFMCISSIFLPAIIRWLGAPDNRATAAELHRKEINAAYQNGLRAGQREKEKIIEDLESKLGNANDRIAMCNVYHKTEHRLALQLTGLQHQAEIQKELLARKTFDYEQLLSHYTIVNREYETIKMSTSAQLLQKLSDKDIEIFDLGCTIEKLQNSDSAKELRDAEKKWEVKMEDAVQKWKVKIEDQEARHGLALKALEEKLEEQHRSLQTERELSKSTLAQANLDKSLANASLQDALGQIATLGVAASRQLTTIHQHEEAMTSARAEAGRFMEAFQSATASKQALMDNVLELEKTIADLNKKVQTQEKQIEADVEERGVLWNRHKDSLQAWYKEKKGLKDANSDLIKEVRYVKGSWEAMYQQLGAMTREVGYLKSERGRLEAENKHYRGQNTKAYATLAKMSQEIKALKQGGLKSSTPGCASDPAPTSASASAAAPVSVTASAPDSPAVPVASSLPVALSVPAPASPAPTPRRRTAQEELEQQLVDEQLALMKSMSFDD